jgi:hypothetical protein
MSEAKTKHLEFIQTTINRMATNSFLLKGWAVTLVGGLIALSFKEIDRRYLGISAVVIALFWMLDSYYLSRERKFVFLYEHVRKKREADIDFAMHTDEFGGRWCWLECAFSKTILVLYGGLGIVLGLINYFIK